MSNSRLSLYLQSIRGPVLLMTLGVLCALHQADIASFRLTWPVLIIVVGVLVLGERLTASPVVAAPFQATVGSAFPPQGYQVPGVPPPGGWPSYSSQPAAPPQPTAAQPSQPPAPQPGERR